MEKKSAKGLFTDKWLVFASEGYKILSLMLRDGIAQSYTIHLPNNLFAFY